MIALLFGKYKNIVVAVALFLILDASVLMMNFYISFEIAEDASSVNMAGRQRMLSQKMMKSLFDIEYSFKDWPARENALAELKHASTLFDKTLYAFEHGGLVRGASGEPLNLKAVNTLPAISLIADTKTVWLPYMAKLKSLTNSRDEIALSQSLRKVLAIGRDNNMQLLALMNELTVELERVARSKASRLRLIQSVGISLAVINFFIVLFHFLAKLKTSDEKLELAQRETTEILNNVVEGLFLIDRKKVLYSQYSKSLEQLFSRNKLGGLSFEALLHGVVPEKLLVTTRRFIALLFKEEVNSNLIGDLNPLSNVQVVITNANGSFVRKYFHFRFERVYFEGCIKDILVTVSDITERVNLERDLDLIKDENARQLELLTSILQVKPEYLNTYIAEVFTAAKSINKLLSEPVGTTTRFREKLNKVFIIMHRLKGEAVAFGLQSFADIAHEFERVLNKFTESTLSTNDDISPLVVQLEVLVKHTEAVQMLAGKLAGFSVVHTSTVQSEVEASNSLLPAVDNRWAHLDDLVTSVSQRCGKQVVLVVSGLSEVPENKALRSVVNDLAVQIIRNSIMHGIESPELRSKQRKDPLGRIDLRFAYSTAGLFEFSVTDDGGGVDIDTVRKKALAMGKWSAVELESWGAKKLLFLIFEPGFTTSEKHQMDCGSGVGMELVRVRVNSMGGKIRLNNRRGLGFKITVTFSRVAMTRLAA